MNRHSVFLVEEDPAVAAFLTSALELMGVKVDCHCLSRKTHGF